MLLQSLLRPVLTPLMRGMFDAPIFSSAPWSPLALWPDGIATPGMWISPRDLTSQWADYLGTTPVATPGTVADSANPVGLALDIRAGAPEVLGPELVVNGGPFVGADWTTSNECSVSGGLIVCTTVAGANAQAYQGLTYAANTPYEVTITIDSLVGELNVFSASSLNAMSFTTAGEKTFTAVAATVDYPFITARFLTGASGVISSISVKEIPGNHMLQSTSAARPLLSARVNLLTYTESYTTNWSLDGVTLSGKVISETAVTAPHRIYSEVGFVSGVTYTFEVELKAGTSIYGHVNSSLNGLTQISINLQTGVIFAGAGAGVSIRAGSNGSWIVTVTGIAGAYHNVLIGLTNSAGQEGYMGNPANNIEVIRAQVNIGQPTPYQAILTEGSTYPSTGFPIAQLYDGVDDGMATAAFSAGTLIDGMDCMIVVRRDSAAATYLISNTGSRGFFEWESGDTNRPDVSAGTPTYYVDGVSCTATRGALFTALTVGDWHILEARGLDLSTWTALEVSSLVSYRLNGPRGDILLYPSTASTEDKDAARQWLADYYGVTLP